MKESVEKDKKFNMYCIIFHPSHKQKKKGIWKLLLENIGFQSTTLELFLKKKPKKQKYVLKNLFERKHTICLFSHI